MFRKLFVPSALFVLCALLLSACTGTTNENATTNTNSTTTTTTTTTSTNKNATTATSPATASSPATATSPASTTTTTASAEKIGVPECDDFIAKYEACVTGKVPEAARAQYNAGLAQWRDSWRKLAANPQTKATLAQACKQSLEQARTSMKSYNCEF